jgi:hypothetical protein
VICSKKIRKKAEGAKAEGRSGGFGFADADLFLKAESRCEIGTQQGIFNDGG